MQANREKLRIAFLSEIPTPYRVPVYKLISQEPGIQCRFFFCAQIQADRAWPIDDFHSLDQTVLKGWQFQRKGKNTLTTFFNPEIISQLWRGKFDLVIIGGWRQPTMLLALLTCLIKRLPYVLHSESHAFKPRTFFKRLVKQLYPGFFVRHAKGYLLTGTLAERHVVSMGAKPDKCFIFPNTIDVTKYQKEAQRLSKKKSFLRDELNFPAQNNFLFVGRLVKVKGVEDVLDGFLKIADALTDWGLVLIGDGPLRQPLYSKVWHSPYKDRILLLPYVDPTDLVRYYVASDIFVLPSHDEPWAVVVNEASACGLPLILSSHVGAAADLLKDGENGYLLPPKEVGRLTEKMLQLGMNQELRQQMQARSTAIIKDWGYERNMQGFTALLEMLSKSNLFQPKSNLNETSDVA